MNLSIPLEIQLGHKNAIIRFVACCIIDKLPTEYKANLTYEKYIDMLKTIDGITPEVIDIFSNIKIYNTHIKGEKHET